MIARAWSAAGGIFGLALLLSACASSLPPPAQQPQAAPNVVLPRDIPDDLNTITPPPPGADESYFRDEYGPPDFVRQEIESQLWRYDGSDCSLFLFLYIESESYVLRHAQTDPPGADGTINSACLSSIKNRLVPSS